MTHLVWNENEVGELHGNGLYDGLMFESIRAVGEVHGSIFFYGFTGK